MTPSLVIELGREALKIALFVGAPLLGVALLTGLVVSLFQAVTQIQEQTLSFVPKVLVVGTMIGLLMPWMLRVLVGYMRDILLLLPNVVP